MEKPRNPSGSVQGSKTGSQDSTSEKCGLCHPARRPTECIFLSPISSHHVGLPGDLQDRNHASVRLPPAQERDAGCGENGHDPGPAGGKHFVAPARDHGEAHFASGVVSMSKRCTLLTRLRHTSFFATRRARVTLRREAGVVDALDMPCPANRRLPSPAEGRIRDNLRLEPYTPEDCRDPAKRSIGPRLFAEHELQGRSELGDGVGLDQ
jgi:hypothetical protein